MPGKTIIRSTKEFEKSFLELPKGIQSKLEKQIKHLRDNPKHPSLKMHKLNDEWEFYVDLHYRCFFLREGNIYTLLVVGRHKIVDRHKRK